MINFINEIDIKHYSDTSEKISVKRLRSVRKAGRKVVNLVRYPEAEQSDE